MLVANFLIRHCKGYGAEVADLHFLPDALFRRLRPYANPLDFIALDPVFRHLRDGFQDDMSHAGAIAPDFADPGQRLHLLPAAALGTSGWVRAG